MALIHRFVPMGRALHQDEVLQGEESHSWPTSISVSLFQPPFTSFILSLYMKETELGRGGPLLSTWCASGWERLSVDLPRR